MGAAVHGFLVFGHALGLIYNGLRVARGSRRNVFDVAAHALALGYSTRAIGHHLRWQEPACKESRT